MGKGLAIDYGTRRTGIAITDNMQIIASALTTVNTHDLEAFITSFLNKEDIDFFVVGDPKNLDGTKNDISGHVNGFVQRLKRLSPKIPVHRIDERYTSKIAKQSILASGLRKKARKKKSLIDEVSATIMLQNYLDYR